ncbi:DUF4279 domain-containing protein [Marinibactrum halimedae]|uniref:DUF4279 domain-containing protein n=1 Tax=Marinibactrum halimedae TaxID=1444977 RepID=A0AA37WL19_9GAMM|nr:DUF4279 domain-containing protein [Marinibactrum halimedae]MCD9459154.1 DUF4279 domain-containing protein [Marinibactrum halimedae]GLS24755.1 hypothetical protein GCM10007877_04690 [Marinibactrum halimedae]
MALISRTKATLRISGDDLLPEDITNSLGGFPTHEQTRGEELETSSGSIRVAKFGMWCLCATEQEPGDLDCQISEILEQLTSNLNAWQELADNYKIDLFCGLFMEDEMEGISLSPESLQKLGERNILLDLDIYGPDEAEENL